MVLVQIERASALQMCGLKAQIEALSDAVREAEEGEGLKALMLRVNECYRNIKKRAASNPSLHRRAVALKLGGVNETLIRGSFKKFALKNALPHRAQVFGMRFREIDGSLSVPVCLDGEREDVNWAAIRKYRQGSSVHYLHPEQNRLLFKTDLIGKLDPEYTFTHQGITHRKNQLIPFDKVDHWEGGYQLTVKVALKDPNRPSFPFGDHSYLELIDSEGNVYSFGLFGPVDGAAECADYAYPFGWKNAHIHCPDDYSTVPVDERSHYSVSFSLSEEDFNRIKERVSQDMQNKSLPFSLGKNNCTSYVCRILKEEMNIKLEGHFTPLGYLMKRLLPNKLSQWLIKSTRSMLSRLPKWLKPWTPLFPPYYLFCFSAALILKFWGLWNHKGQKGWDYPPLKILFSPHECTIDHPSALKDTLLSQYGSLTKGRPLVPQVAGEAASSA